MSLLPINRDARKAIPLYSGVLAYFPAALVKVATRSKEGNDEHNPGQPLHWSRDKSADHLDCIARHLTEGDLVGVAWRALAALQLECEANGAPLAPGARFEAIECGGCAPPVYASPRQVYEEALSTALGQDAKLDGLPASSASRQFYKETNAFVAAQESALGGLPAESAYLASFSPNGSRLATPAEIDRLRGFLDVATLGKYDIGDVAKRHVMHAEALRDHDERLNGPEDHL